MTVTDPDSIGILIDGDKAIVNNDGDNAISNGGTGTQVNGDEATGTITVKPPLMVRARPARKSRVITL